MQVHFHAHVKIVDPMALLSTPRIICPVKQRENAFLAVSLHATFSHLPFSPKQWRDYPAMCPLKISFFAPYKATQRHVAIIIISIELHYFSTHPGNEFNGPVIWNWSQNVTSSHPASYIGICILHYVT